MNLKTEEKKKVLLWSVVCTVVFSLLAHGYRFSNNMYTHDSLLMIYQNDYAWQIALGRIVQPVLIFLRGSICNPWLISMASIFWTILSVYALSHLLDRTSGLDIALLSGLMVCNVVVTVGNASYLPWVDFYSLACFLAILGVWFCRKAFAGLEIPDRKSSDSSGAPDRESSGDCGSFHKRSLWYLVPGAFSMAVSLGIYQSYICVAIGLMMMVLLFDLLHGMNWKIFWKKTVGFLLTLAVAAVIYYIAWKIFQKVFNIWTSDSYNGLAGVGDYSDTSLPALLVQTYENVFYFLWNPDTFTTLIFHNVSLSIIWIWILRLCNLAVLGLILVSLVMANRKNKTNLWQRALQAVILLLFPLGINFVCFISKGMEHTLMIFAFLLIYVLAICCKNQSQSLLLKTILFCIPFALVIWVNVVYANQVYLKKELITESATHLMNRIVDDIEDQEDYEAGVTPVAFYGNFQTSEYVQELADFEEIMPYGMGKSSVTYVGADYALIKYILNVNMNLTRVDTSNETMMQTVEAMPCYPDKESIRYVDGVLVVKIAEF